MFNVDQPIVSHDVDDVPEKVVPFVTDCRAHQDNTEYLNKENGIVQTHKIGLFVHLINDEKITLTRFCAKKTGSSTKYRFQNTRARH